MYFSPSYPTRDGIIPFRLFCMLYAAIESVAAMERINMARGVSMGIGLAMDGSKVVDSEGFKGELRLAFPESHGV